ncbi:MAG: GGDEF domain-containing protein [Lachnospiraceae bacterium]|nr:GGDEF domain-containing protein [Lachnospiraceae bacterium]MBR6486852.1 GGDEF domain-containing protein [Lachnospiraceae bacterium]
MAKEKKEKEVKKKVKKEKEVKKPKYEGKVAYDMGSVLVFSGFVLAAIALAYSGEELYKENLTMVAVIFTVAVLAAFRVVNAATIMAAIQTILFLGVRVAAMATTGFENQAMLCWVFVPGLVVSGYSLINRAKAQQERTNEVKDEQIDELIMTDPVTGLYNLRSMYMDIQTQISYAERNNKQICLMILKPKYVDEMKTVLKKSEFNEVVVRLSKVVCDTVRLEDRVYSIDSEGGFGVILTCDLAGSKLVENRLTEKFGDKSLYAGVVPNNDIRIEMRLGCVQYNEALRRDAIKLKEIAEAELKDIKMSNG